MLGIVHLNRESILDAAVSILNAYGLADMTMRRVAKQLNVAPGALYWHFKNKQELIDATARRILEPALSPEVPVEQVFSIIDSCTELRNLMNDYRDGADVISAALSSSLLREDLETYISKSLEKPDAVGAFTLLHFVVGAVLAEQSQRQLAELTNSASVLTAKEKENLEIQYEDRFSTGVKIIIAGLDSLSRIR